MAGDAEDRLKRAMDLLFSSPPSTSSPPSSTVAELNRKAGSIVIPNQILAPQSLRSLSGNATPTLSSHRICRPWDKGDFFRRLATFKSMTWFGKPELADPVNCARKGWVNVDVDLIACEGCNAMLSFPTPSTWTQHEAENAAATFSEKLDSGHKSLCPWKDNACLEILAQFPPTSVEALVKGFNDRCKALSQLIGLPTISQSAIQFLKTSRGPQINSLLSMSPIDLATADDMVEGITADSQPTSVCNYDDAQKIISLCGWQLQLLPYSVVCIDENKGSSISECESISQKSSVLGHQIMITSLKKEKAAGTGETSESTLYQEPKSDVGSAVLVCSLCGASVGLWLFKLVTCPSGMDKRESGIVLETSQANRIEQGRTAGQDGKQEIEISKSAGDIVTNSPSMSVKRPANFLNLRLSIAGGLPPTPLSKNLEPSLSPKVTPPFTSAEKDYTSLKRKREECTELESIKPSLFNGSDVDPVRNEPKNTVENAEVAHKNIIASEVDVEHIVKRSCHDEIKAGAAQISTDTNTVFGDGREELDESGISARYKTERITMNSVGDKVGELWTQGTKEFDPILHHRHFCPWVNSNIGKGSCGWQLTLDALEMSTSAKADSTSVYSADPLSSVRKVLGRSRVTTKALKK